MGIGIVFTFWNMFDVFKNFKTGSDINLLIQHLSPTFLSSLAGVLIGLVQTPFIKNKVDKLEKKSESKNPNPYDLLKDIITNTKSTTEALNNFIEQSKKDNKDYLVELKRQGETLNSDLISDFKIALTESIERSSGNAINESLEKIASINQSFVETLNTLQTSNNKLIGDQIERSNEIVTGFNDSIGGKVTEMLESFGASIQTMNDKFIELSKDSNTKLDESLTKMINSFILNSEKSGDAVAIFGRKIEEMGYGITERADYIIATRIIDLDQKMNTITTLIESRTNELNNYFDNINNAQLRSETFISDVTKKFQQAVNQFENTIGEREIILDEMRKQLVEIKQLRESGSSLVQECEDILEGISQLGNRVTEINNVIMQLDGIKEQLNRLAN